MPFDISLLVIKIPVLLFALTIHEYAHGRVALAMGDPTALRAGRLTMNPIKHIDPLGAICLFLFNFGWARPVPIDPRYFRTYRSATIYVSVAGPAANFCAALAAGLLVRYAFMPWEVYQQALLYLLLMNIGLGLFNLIPIPPLDGSHVLENILPRQAAMAYGRFQRYGPLVLIGVILLDNFAHTGIIRFILLRPMFHIAHLFAGEGFFRLIGFQ